MRVSNDLRWASAALLAGGAALLVASGILLARGLFAGGREGPRQAPRPARAAPRTCALPAGIEAARLPGEERSRLARWATLCADLEAGRISAETFRAERKALFAEPPAPPAQPAPPEVVWASEVRQRSSEYGSDDWSARQALGPPDVFPRTGDDTRAWAPETADSQVEVLELGFAGGAVAGAVEIYETYNPGAITRIEILGPGGEVRSVYEAAAGRASGAPAKRTVEFACSAFPVTAVRITLDSPAVPGWNEIDAVGLRRCR